MANQMARPGGATQQEGAMAVWLHHPGDYRSTCPHCGWSERAGQLAVATDRMVIHEETQCRWWERHSPVVADEAEAVTAVSV